MKVSFINYVKYLLDLIKMNKNVLQHWLAVIVASRLLPNFLRKSESIRIFGLASNKTPQHQLAKNR